MEGAAPEVDEPALALADEVVDVPGNSVLSVEPVEAPVALDDGGAEVLGRPDVLSVDVGGCSDGPVVVGG